MLSFLMTLCVSFTLASVLPNGAVGSYVGPAASNQLSVAPSRYTRVPVEQRDVTNTIVATFNGEVFSWTTTVYANPPSATESAMQSLTFVTSASDPAAESTGAATTGPAPYASAAAISTAATDIAPLSSTMEPSSPPASQTAVSSASATSTNDCASSASLFLNFDDTPIFDGGDNSTFPPIFSPYHHLFFSNGYAHAPPPSDPYPPRSGAQLAVFMPGGAQDADSWPGEIGAGPHAPSPFFHFDAHGAWLGCDDGGSSPCTVVFTGFHWDNATSREVSQTIQYVTIPACPGYDSCQLQYAALDAGFNNLSGMQIQALVENKPVIFFMDDVDLTWTDASCEADNVRNMVRRLS